MVPNAPKKHNSAKCTKLAIWCSWCQRNKCNYLKTNSDVLFLYIGIVITFSELWKGSTNLSFAVSTEVGLASKVISATPSRLHNLFTEQRTAEIVAGSARLGVPVDSKQNFPLHVDN